MGDSEADVPRAALAAGAGASASRGDGSPPIAMVERLLANGERDRAVRVAFERALADLVRGTGVPARPEMTGREFLSWALGPGSPIATLRRPFERLRRLYEPARFGEGATSVDGLVETLTELYRTPALSRLYRRAKFGPGGA